MHHKRLSGILVCRRLVRALLRNSDVKLLRLKPGKIFQPDRPRVLQRRKRNAFLLSDGVLQRQLLCDRQHPLDVQVVVGLSVAFYGSLPCVPLVHHLLGEMRGVHKIIEIVDLICAKRVYASDVNAVCAVYVQRSYNAVRVFLDLKLRRKIFKRDQHRGCRHV